MPPKRQRKPRAPKCSYFEDGRRCPKDGVGNPPLCPPHAATLRAASEAPYNPLRNVVEAVKTGKPVSAGDVISAAADLFATMLGGRPIAPPTVEHEDAPRQPPPSSGGWSPFGAWWQAQQQQQGRQAPPPPRADELLAARAAARKIFGWKSDHRLDADELKKRYRDLAKRNHPDRGGSVEKMARVNAAMDILTAELESR